MLYHASAFHNRSRPGGFARPSVTLARRRPHVAEAAHDSGSTVSAPTFTPTGRCSDLCVPRLADFVCNEQLRYRFNGIGRLYGSRGLERLRASHVCVIGLGGVGSWVVEAVARSGVGALTLVDLDEVCVSNTNRQLCALESTVGRPKAEVLKSRVLGINPDCAVTSLQHFVTRESARELLSSGSIASSLLDDAATSNCSGNDYGHTVTTELQPQVEGSVFDFVVDGIDGVDDKAALLAACVDLKVPVITSGGAGGLTDPTALRTCDMLECENDRLMKKVRKKMRQQYGFPKGMPGNLASAQVRRTL